MGETKGLILLFQQDRVLAMLRLKPQNMRGKIPPSSFYRQLADYYLHIFSLIHPVGEFSFKEMRTYGQFKILSYIKRSRRQGKSKIPSTSGGKLLCRPSSSHKRLLDRVPFEIMYVALAKSPSTREASHQHVFTNSCLTISYTRLPCLPSR